MTENWVLTHRRRALALFEVLLCSSLPTQLFLGAVLNAFGLAARGPTGLSLSYVLWLSVLDSGLLIVLMVAILRLHGDSPAALWRGQQPWRRESLLGLALVPLIVVAVGLLLGTIRQFFPGLHNVPDNPLEALAAGGPVEAALFGVMAIIAGGVREELQRAFLLQRFERHLGGTIVGVVVLSTAFGLGHLLQGWDAAITTGALGALWAMIYVRRRSSIAPIVSHAGFNAIEVLRVAVGGPTSI